MKLDRNLEEQYEELTYKIDSISSQFYSIKRNLSIMSCFKMMYYIEIQHNLVMEVFDLCKKLVKYFSLSNIPSPMLTIEQNLETLPYDNSLLTTPKEFLTNIFIKTQNCTCSNNRNDDSKLNHFSGVKTHKFKSKSLGELNDKRYELQKSFSYKITPTTQTRLLLSKSYSIVNRYNFKEKVEMRYREKIRKNKHKFHFL